jgi:hypothetical protein
MSVRLDDDVIRLEGRCHVEDAEPLLLLLQADPGRRLDLSQAESIHSAFTATDRRLRRYLCSRLGHSTLG